MKIEITPELIRNYFHGTCTVAEKREVENWLKSADQNHAQAMRWLKEEDSAEDEKFLMSLLMSEEEVLQQAQDRIEHQDDRRVLFSQSGKKTGRGFWYAAAASVSLLIMTAWLIKSYTGHRKITIETTFEETKKIVLPDSSVVFLNGNSSISYLTSGFSSHRHIQLRGEAFFDVTHLADNQAFEVHLSDSKRIQVLGTEFNVSDRENVSKVVLKSGRIRLDIPSQSQNVVLSPGQMIKVDNKLKTLVKENVNPELFYSWINGKWKFDRATLKDVMAAIRETRGIQVNVYDLSLIDRTISGTIPLKGDAKTLITNVANAFDLVVEDRQGGYYLKERK